MTDHHPPDAIVTRGLRKSFRAKGETIAAVEGVDLRVQAGEIFAILGPNGAGKTTTLRMLATLLRPDGGQATVAGADVVRQPGLVRRRIGYVGQRGGADLAATGRENLLVQARLYGASRAEAARRADDAIARFALQEFAGRVARTYSGGQRRRLELALGVIHHPRVLFLDEPTLGLDPQNRVGLWEHVRALRDTGTAVVLTTHYLEEADLLADRVAIIDHGRIVTEGSPHELKRRLGGDVLELRPRGEATALDGLVPVLAGLACVREARVAGGAIRLHVVDGARALPRLLELLADRALAVDALSLSAPSLEDVFLHETGRSLRDAGHEPKELAA